jgi:anti-sigma factor RsiW
MNDDLHLRARNLIDTERVEGLRDEEARWLAEHLAGCDACARRAAATDAALRALRSVSVVLPHGLAAATRLRVRQRAEEQSRSRARNAALVAGCALSWLVGVASAPLVWRAFAWLGATFDLPRVVWILGFACWWLVPVAAAAILVWWQRTAAAGEMNGEPMTRRDGR